MEISQTAVKASWLATFGSRTLHQDWLPGALCKYPCTSVCQCRPRPRFPALSAFRPTLLCGSSSLCVTKAQGSKVAEKMGHREQTHVKQAGERTMQRQGSGFRASRSGGGGVGRNGRDVAGLEVDKDVQEGSGSKRRNSSGGVGSQKDVDVNSSGFSSIRYGDEWPERKSRKSKASAMGDKDMRTGTGGKHGRTSRGVGSENNTGVHSSGFSSLSSGDDRPEGNSRKSKASVMTDAGHEEKRKKIRVSSAGKEGKERTGKKGKVNSAKVELRIGLDMCSKRGDVMRAISLYDSAVREEVKLDQYHYNVLLYLCASAAGGVVHPAKSGSNSHSSSGTSPKDAYLNNEPSNVVDGVQLNGDEYAFDTSNGSPPGSPRSPTANVSSAPVGSSCAGRGSGSRGGLFDGPSGSFEITTTSQFPTRTTEGGETENYQIPCLQNTAGALDVPANKTAGYSNRDKRGIQVTEDMRKYALSRGFEIYKKMCLEGVPLSEAALTSVARMAMSMGDGDMAFEIVKKIKGTGLTLRLRSYDPALFTYCDGGDIEKAFEVERHMVESSVHPEEPELQALLRVSIRAGRGDKVYYILQKLRTTVRQISPATAELVESWFKSPSASRVGKRKWDQKLIEEAFENGGGGWHGLGWLGKGKWSVVHAHVDANGICESCGDKLVTIDLDPVETENFARSVASVAGKRERSSNFQKFQKWLDYYGPFEAVIDAANVGLFSQRRFSLTKVNSVANGIRQKLPSKKWPLVIVHNKRIYGAKMNDSTHIKLVEKWKNADSIYTTPTGSNDDWYWLYAAIKCKSLIVTNDEMRDHIFQVLGNDFFPKWKERHQVHFSFHDGSPEFLMPPPCSIVIQESEQGHWHIPIAVEGESDKGRIWLCVRRASTLKETRQEVKTRNKRTDSLASSRKKLLQSNIGNTRNIQAQDGIQSILRSLQGNVAPDDLKDSTITFNLETAEKLCGCVIDFQI